jgi:hypothetical protein
MLQSFRFANHRSFPDEQQLNLMPAFPADQPGGASEPVRVVGIFGANASGKSNVLDAFNFMCYQVRFSDRETEPDRGISRRPFRLSAEYETSPSRFVVDLLLQGVHHTYGFTIDDDVVLEEWLYRHSPEHRDPIVFVRERDEYEWGPEGKKVKGNQLIAGINGSTSLFLSGAARSFRAAENPVQVSPVLFDVYRWFSRAVWRSVDSQSALRSLQRQTISSDRQKRLVDLLRAADTGIVDIEVESDELDESDSSNQSGQPSRLRNARIRFLHTGSDIEAYFDMREESSGTLKLLALGNTAIRVLDSGGTLIVDELDASLHPMLTTQIIELFRASKSNPHRAQLLFTTHDAALLGSLNGQDVLKRDEIWFTEKDEEGASTIYSLAEFKPRKEGENRDRRYLNGSYGAVPDISGELFTSALGTRQEASPSVEAGPDNAATRA